MENNEKELVHLKLNILCYVVTVKADTDFMSTDYHETTLSKIVPTQ